MSQPVDRSRARATAVRRAALAATAAMGLAMPAAAQAGSLLGISIGGKPVLNVSLGEESSGSSKPLVGVSVLTPTGSGETQVAGVSLNGNPVVEVKSPPAVTVAETPVTPPVTVSVPTVATPPPSSGTGTTSTPSSGTSQSTQATTATAGTTSHGTATVAAGGPSSRSPSAAVHAGRAAAHSRRGARKGAGGSGSAGTPTTGTATVPTAGAPTARHGQGDPLTAERAKSTNPLSTLGESLPIPLPVPDWSKPIILALLLLALGLWLRSRKAVRRARGLERRQVTLLADLDAMQAALVPAVPERIAGAALSVAYRPAEGPAAGGDFYDVFARSEDEVAIILGDVTGHGREALEQAALTRYTLRAHMQTASSPREALALAGAALAAPGGERLATVAAAVYDRRRGTLTYALAGHPHPILLGVDVPESPVSCSSPPVGWDVPTGLRQRTVTLPPGARACFFSDGLVEARWAGGEAGSTLLGRERLRGLLELATGARQAEGVLAAIRTGAEATPDDMAACILTAETEPSGRHMDLEELEIDEHTVEAGNLQGFLEGCGLRQVVAERLVRRARVEVHAGGKALLLVDRSRGEPRATVGRIGSTSPREDGGQALAGTPAEALTGT
jgi:hypothetical protein